MKYEVTVIKNGKVVENYLADEYTTVSSTGRCGHKIEKMDREISDVKVRPEGKKRNKTYNHCWETVIIKEATTGRRILTMEQKQY